MALPESVYILIFIFGLLYLLLSWFIEFEFFGSEWTYGLPFALTAWGGVYFIFGEPIAITFGISIYAFLLILYHTLTRHLTLADEVLYKSGTVTISIYPNQKGEVKIEHDYGNEFYVAKANNITKPIPEGEKVLVEDVDENVIIVSNTIHNKERDQSKSVLNQILDSVFRVLSLNHSVSGTCMICFGIIQRSRDALWCPNCEKVAHRNHMRNWLEIKNLCPNCKCEIKYHRGKLQIKGNRI